MESFDLRYIKAAYGALPESDKLFFLEWLYKKDKHKWEFATMCEGLRKFHDKDSKRG